MVQLTKEKIFQALKDNRFQLYGQPKWSFGKNTCNTYEVFPDLLLSPKQEPILPADFLPIIFSDKELTDAFGSWMLDKAFSDAKMLMKKLGVELTVSMNVLGHQANQPEFLDRLRELIQKHGLSCQNVQFELSEVQPLNQIGVDNFNRLREECGVRLILGNFGTGYSNIDILRKIPFDIIEISKEFISSITDFDRDFKIVISILEMAKVLCIDVCAKGIETAEQMEMLEDAGFKMGQGFLIGRPLPIDELYKFLLEYAEK